MMKNILIILYCFVTHLSLRYYFIAFLRLLFITGNGNVTPLIVKFLIFAANTASQ